MNKQEILEKAQKQPDEREVEIIKTSHRLQLVTMLFVTVLYDIVLFVLGAMDKPLTFEAGTLITALTVQMVSGQWVAAIYCYVKVKRKADLAIIIIGALTMVAGILAVVAHIFNW